ncbi:MAG: hypothetical protein Q9202_005013 [Teloschistes flavicans]
MMLLAKAFVRVLEMCDQGRTDHLSKKLTQFKVPLALVQIHNRTLMAQALAAVRGSEQLPETLAYAILTLKELQCLPWPDGSIKENRRFIEANQYTLELCREDWMARSSAKAYCMAATMVYTQPRTWTEMTASLFQVPQRALQDVTRQFSRLPDFQGIPFWKIEASVNEGLMFLPELRAHRKGLPNDILLTRKDEFLVFIPTTCVVLNNLSYLEVPSGIIWDTMIWILGLYRIDEYIETELKAMQADDIEDLRRFIATICEARSEDPDSLNKAELHFSSSSANVYTKSEGSTALLYRHNSGKMEAVHVVLRSYINSMLLHPAVTAGPASAIKPLRLAIAEFMNGQLSQSLLNSDLASQRLACYSSTISVYRTPQCFTSYLRDIGSPTFGANVAFAFFICLVGGLPTLKARYLGDQYAERMGRMSRLFNDLTGIERDQDEGNLNCVNFAEFHGADNGMDEGLVRTEDDMGAVSGRTSEMAKQRLENLAIYEREQMYTVGQQLVEEIRRVGGEGTEKKVGVVKLIGQVLKLYTDLYGVRDLSNRIERTEWLPRL